VLNIQKQTSERSAFSILEGAASKWADHTACIDASGSRSFKQLLDDARAVAGELEALRIPPLAIVGISAASASDFLPSLFGVLAVGAVAMPIAPELSDLEQQRLIRETGVSWRIVENASASPGEQKHSIPGTSLALHQVATSKILTHFAPLFPDAAIIRHTSGTTGPSRGVVLSHRAIEERTITSQQLLGVREGDVILSPLSISYHFIASALTFIRSGATILDATALTPEQAFTLAKNKRASMIYANFLMCDGQCHHQRHYNKEPQSHLPTSLNSPLLKLSESSKLGCHCGTSKALAIAAHLADACHPFRHALSMTAVTISNQEKSASC
jgi:long-chain acyl-CoA synthetase